MGGPSAEDRQHGSPCKLSHESTDVPDLLVIECRRLRQVFLQRQHLRRIDGPDRHRRDTTTRRTVLAKRARKLRETKPPRPLHSEAAQQTQHFEIQADVSS
jgi:hypothetical protein